ncbi:MAG: hypothetical protein AAGH65_05800 [Pseudomonadota bacterium]
MKPDQVDPIFVQGVNGFDDGAQSWMLDAYYIARLQGLEWSKQRIASRLQPGLHAAAQDFSELKAKQAHQSTG